MKKIFVSVTVAVVCAAVCGIAFVAADYISPCPKQVPGTIPCSSIFSLPTDKVKRFCSSQQNVSQEECIKSLQDITDHDIATGTMDAQSSETFTSNDVDPTTVKCFTAKSCKWFEGYCVLDEDDVYYPTGIVLYKAKYCSNGEDVPQD
jgi:hypothetical protein